MAHCVNGAPAKAEHRCDGDLVIRVHEDEVLREKEADDARLVARVDWNARVARLVAPQERLEGELGLDVDGEHMVELGHDHGGALLPKLERGRHEVLLLGAQVPVGILRGNGEQLVKLLAIVDGAQLAAERKVKNLRDGPSENVEHDDEHAHEGHGLGPNHEAVLGAHRLRDDLAKDEDEGRGEHGAHGSRGEIRGEDGDEGVDRRVAK
mmetsp:Transcript_60/g.245  ORF Transcript_60/g.245 Transcript_60/m.245 type:complete len:209 (+) Transcript_60:1770-2396(+)